MERKKRGPGVGKVIIVAGWLREHLRAIERAGLRPEIGGARGIEHVHRHVVGIRPNPDLRVVMQAWCLPRWKS